MCLAEMEKGTAFVQTWRGPGARPVAYLRNLAGWGYQLSEAEEHFCQLTEKAEAAARTGE